jgi:predicted aspartyl protease
MKLKINQDSPISFFVRIKGPRCARELRAILDTGSSCCTIPIVDAREMGYDAFYDPLANKGEGALALTQGGILDVQPLTLQEISVAGLSATNIEALAYQLPRLGGADMILGLSFLRHFKLTLDFKAGELCLEKLE